MPDHLLTDTTVLDLIAQVGLFVFGVLAIVLVAQKNKWGFVFGVIAQPFWFITAYVNEQWGVFALCFVYTGSWLYGCYNWFLEDQSASQPQ